MENANRFLNAYSKIENHLRTKYDYSNEKSFKSIITEVARNDALIRNKETDLKQYHELRNAIVHNRRDGKPIADPYIETVKNLEQIVDTILDPPKVYPTFKSEVATLSDETPISEAVSLMHGHSFSQIPILDESDSFLDLLTANTITRWLGANIDDGLAILEEKTVSDALAYKEDFESYRFISRDTNLAEVLSLYDENKETEEVINALLITQNGKKSEKLMGLITHYDLPEIYRRL